MSQARSVHNSGHGGDAHHGGDGDSNVHCRCSAVWTGLLHLIDWLWSAMWQVVGSLITNVAAIKLDQWSDGLALCIMVVGEWVAIAKLSRISGPLERISGACWKPQRARRRQSKGALSPRCCSGRGTLPV